MSKFWTGWLNVWCAVVLAFGAFLALAAVPALDGGVRLVLSLFSGGSVPPEALDQPIVRFGIGLQGALTLGWGLTMMALIDAAKTLGAPMWRKLTIALVVWYVVDSAISIVTGLTLNAGSNTVLMAGYLIPVLVSGVLRDQRA
ncbi:MAG: hypothetical protein K2P70_16450 [Hyphomonadaceae bacterium]|nr:hypothetical protein [Hyphomonadaceae bacterium]